MKINKYINFQVFLVSFLVGLAIVYFYSFDKKVVIVYPTPENTTNYQFKDTVQNCFSFQTVLVDCPADKNKVRTIPIQE